MGLSHSTISVSYNCRTIQLEFESRLPILGVLNPRNIGFNIQPKNNPENY